MIKRLLGVNLLPCYRLTIEPRQTPSRLMQYLSPFVASLLMLTSGLVIFILLDQDPIKAFYAFFIDPINDLYGLGELLIKAAPLMLIGSCLAIGFKAGIWNIGSEGQLAMGAIGGALVAILLQEQQGWYVLPFMGVVGVVFGMFWAAIPAFLKTHYNANEILVTLMLNYVAILLLGYMVHGPLIDPDGYGFPQSIIFPDQAILPIMIGGTRLHYGVLLAFAGAIVAWLFSSKSFAGYKLEVAGLAPKAVAYAGFKKNRLVWLALLIGGAGAGLAGTMEVAGPIGQLLPSVSPGYGYSAIIVAFVGRLSPLGAIPASVLMALLYLGGESAQMNLGLSAAVTGVFQGLLLFYLLASDSLINYRLTIRKR